MESSARLDNFTNPAHDMASTNTLTLRMVHLRDGPPASKNTCGPSLGKSPHSASEKKCTASLWASMGHALHLFRPPPRAVVTEPPPSLPGAPPRLLAITSSSKIYATTKSPVIAIKVSDSPSALKKEQRLHRRVAAVLLNLASQVASDILLPHVPHCYAYYRDLSKCEISDDFTGEYALCPGTAAFTMEFIRPIHKHHARYLIKRHLSPSVQDTALANITNSHFVANVCLGEVRPLSDQWKADLGNRRVYIDQLHEEKVDVDGIAAFMGSSLAVLHWRCEVYAAGVKFLLGCDRMGRFRLWMADFGDCQPFRPTAHDARTRLVDAVMRNDVCWPRWINLRKYRQMWARFRKAYLIMSARVYRETGNMRNDDYLPRVFIDEL